MSGGGAGRAAARARSPAAPHLPMLQAGTRHGEIGGEEERALVAAPARAALRALTAARAHAATPRVVDALDKVSCIPNKRRLRAS